MEYEQRECENGHCIEVVLHRYVCWNLGFIAKIFYEFKFPVAVRSYYLTTSTFISTLQHRPSVCLQLRTKIIKKYYPIAVLFFASTLLIFILLRFAKYHML